MAQAKAPSKDGKTTFYRTRDGEKYHRDRQCYFLKGARAADTVKVFRDVDPGVGKSLLVRERTYAACARCGR